MLSASLILIAEHRVGRCSLVDRYARSSIVEHRVLRESDDDSVASWLLRTFESFTRMDFGRVSAGSTRRMQQHQQQQHQQQQQQQQQQQRRINSRDASGAFFTVRRGANMMKFPDFYRIGFARDALYKRISDSLTVRDAVRRFRYRSWSSQ